MTTTRRPAIESVGQRFGMLVVTGVDEGEVGREPRLYVIVAASGRGG